MLFVTLGGGILVRFYLNYVGCKGGSNYDECTLNVIQVLSELCGM